MQIRILDAAERDLEEGYRFYEKQSPGVGSYFLDSLYSDIDSLACFEGMAGGLPEVKAISSISSRASETAGRQPTFGHDRTAKFALKKGEKPSSLSI